MEARDDDGGVNAQGRLFQLTRLVWMDQALAVFFKWENELADGVC